MVLLLAFLIPPDGVKVSAVSISGEQFKDAALEFIVSGTSTKAGALNE